ncbi:FGGY-family carbohydrate kinase, partial [Bifidobacterium adolescentis]
LIAMVLEAAEGAEAAQSHAEAIVLPTVLGPRDAAPVKADPAIAGKNVEGGCLLAPGGGDNAMASLGLGMAVGDVSISLGTSGVAAAISENPTYDLTGAVSGFADCTGHYLPLACTINGSRILDAGRAALGVDYDELAKLAFASKPGANGITLVPYFDGERTPNRPNATATFSGMTLANTTRENLARAFVEGLLCSQRDCLELIRSLGASITRILLIGGGAKSEAIRTLAPSILGMDVTRPATDEYVAIGAARQAAWVLSGETEPPAWQLTIDGVETGEPTEAVYEAYAKARG